MILILLNTNAYFLSYIISYLFYTYTKITKSVPQIREIFIYKTISQEMATPLYYKFRFEFFKYAYAINIFYILCATPTFRIRENINYLYDGPN